MQRIRDHDAGALARARRGCERHALLTGQHQAAPSDAAQDDAVCPQQSRGADLPSRREPGIAVQRAPLRQEDRQSTGQQHGEGSGRRLHQAGSHTRLLAVIVGVRENGERSRGTRVRPHHFEE